MTIKIKYDYVEFNTIGVGKLGKFKYTLIQKRVNNMFVTPDICTYDLITNELTNIILTMILIIENKRPVTTVAYLVAPESFLLVVIAIC